MVQFLACFFLDCVVTSFGLASSFRITLFTWWLFALLIWISDCCVLVPDTFIRHKFQVFFQRLEESHPRTEEAHSVLPVVLEVAAPFAPEVLPNAIRIGDVDVE